MNPNYFILQKALIDLKFSKPITALPVICDVFHDCICVYLQKLLHKRLFSGHWWSMHVGVSMCIHVMCMCDYVHACNLNRKLEQEYKESMTALRAELSKEVELVQQQANQQREELEQEISKMRDDETFLRQHLSLTIKVISILHWIFVLFCFLTPWIACYMFTSHSCQPVILIWFELQNVLYMFVFNNFMLCRRMDVWSLSSLRPQRNWWRQKTSWTKCKKTWTVFWKRRYWN